MRKAPIRETFGRTLVEVGAVRSDVVVLVADVSSSVMTDYFAESEYDRLINGL